MRKILIWGGLGLGLVVLALSGLIGVRTMAFTAPAPPTIIAMPDLSAIAIDRAAATAHLSEAIRFNTVSLTEPNDPRRAQFEAFQAWMASTYPACHASAHREQINGLSLFYEWKGSDAALAPLLLMAHQDTVPVPDDTRANWQADPFGGEVRDDYVWGRGSLDDKGSLIAILEACDILARQGMAPKRTIWLAFGHDEELGGENGAQKIVEMLKARGQKAWFALDEGMAIVAEHPLTGTPAALIGVSEKGYGTLRVTATGEPGHSSMPPPRTAISTLALAITRIQNMPIDRRIAGGVAEDMMRSLSASMPFATRMAIANEDLFAPLLNAKLKDNRAAQALLGTTIAPTVISGGSRDNVLPGEASALINLRIHPRDTPENLLARARAAIAGLDGVSVDWDRAPIPASPVSHTNNDAYALLAAGSRALSPDAPVAPGLVLGGTDGRHYAEVAEDVYRFQPVVLQAADWESIHGLNERISVDNFERMIRFYVGVMQKGAE